MDEIFLIMNESNELHKKYENIKANIQFKINKINELIKEFHKQRAENNNKTAEIIRSEMFILMDKLKEEEIKYNNIEKDFELKRDRLKELIENDSNGVFNY